MNTADDDLISFACGACARRSAPAVAGEGSRWAAIAGFESSSARLAGVLDGRALRDIRRDPVAFASSSYLESIPEAGASYVASVRHPFVIRTSQPFWILYQPPDSLANGWEEHIAEIERSCVVQCTIERVVHSADDFALLALRVGEVLPVASLHERLPDRSDAEPELMFETSYIEGAAWRRWRQHVFVSWSLEGDVELWWLIRLEHAVSEGPVQLILQGYSDRHASWFRAGCHRLSADERADLEVLMCDRGESDPG